MAKPQLNDDKGNIWQMSSLPTGQLVATQIGRGTGQPLLMREMNIPATAVYELRIINGGQLGLFRAPANSQGSTELLIDSTDPAIFFFLQVFNGIIQMATDLPFGNPIVVGQLLIGDGAYPRPLQPGGVGTPVTSPVQSDGEKIGLWVAGCQHWFNHWDIHSAQIGGVQTALVCCPICLYIQRLISPYSKIHADENMIIFA